MADAKLNFPITATDQTAKGVGSAGKRFSKLAKDASGVGKDTSGLSRFSQSVASMEAATARSFGRRSVLSAAGERFSAVTHAAQTFSEAREAAPGGGLGSVLGLATSGLGLFAGAVVAAGAAAFSFVDGWAKDAAALGRLSAASGVAARDLDALAAAGERAGVTREQTNASVMSLGKLLNDAQYGRSNETLALENQLGVGVKRDANGTPDTTAFMAALADKIAAQKNPFTQQEIADRFGVSAMLPFLRKGSAGFLAEFNDAKATAQSRDNAQTDVGQEVFSKKARVAQGVARVASDAGFQGAKVESAGLDATLSGERAVAGAVGRLPQTLAGFERTVSGATPRIGHALTEGAHILETGFGRVGRSIEDVVHIIADVARRTGMDVRQMLTTARIESHFKSDAKAKSSSATGLYQFLDRTGASYGVAGDKRKDPRLSAEGYVREIQHDLPALDRGLGRHADPWEVYMLHQRGLSGAIKLLAGDQDRNAVQALGRKEVLNNGGNAGMTVGDYRRFWEGRYAQMDRANERQGIYRIAEAPAGRDRPAASPAPGRPGLPGEPGLPGQPGRAGLPGAPGVAAPLSAPSQAARADQTAPARAEVLIRLAGAPDGTVTRVSAPQGVGVRVERTSFGD